MIYLVSLNEISLFHFLVLILLNKNPRVLRIAPFMLMNQGLLDRLVNWSIRNGKAEYAVKLTPELQHHWDFNYWFNFQEIFKKYEPWQNQYYGFNGARVESDGTYGYAFKKITCSYTFWKIIEIYLIDAISKKSPPGDLRVYGLLADTKELGRYLLGHSFAENIRTMYLPRVVIYPLLISLCYAFSLFWVLLKTRPVVRQSKVALMFDIMKDGREYELLKEIADAGKFVLIDRFPDAPSHRTIPAELDAIVHKRTDGLFPIPSALRCIGLATRDIARISRCYWDAPPSLFFEMLSLSYKRILVRGMLNRYLPKAFIGRDEYNVDHILRRIELKNEGIKSIGLGNALFPCFCSLTANARYASYDTYYLDAAPLFEQYQDTWAPDMEVKTMGGFSMPREALMPKRRTEGEAILFTFRVAWAEPEMIRMVRATANAFPERTVCLQFKPFKIKEEAELRELVSACGDGLDNFEYVTDDVYVLLDRAKYHVSDISTVVAEAIRAGMVTIVADLIDMEFNCYRSFPGLCVTTAEELVEKLRSLESGAPYSRETYFELLGYRDGKIGYDLLREDIGLPPVASS